MQILDELKQIDTRVRQHEMAHIAAAGPCSHIAPVARVKLGPQSTLSYRYWLIVGNEKEITKTLDSLWAKYAQERFSITNPK